jgi:hypothetical protein
MKSLTETIREYLTKGKYKLNNQGMRSFTIEINGINAEIFEKMSVKQFKDGEKYYFIGIYFIPESIVDNKQWMEKVCNYLNPSNCEGQSYIINDREKYYLGEVVYENYKEVVFQFSWG